MANIYPEIPHAWFEIRNSKFEIMNRLGDPVLAKFRTLRPAEKALLSLIYILSDMTKCGPKLVFLGPIGSGTVPHPQRHDGSRPGAVAPTHSSDLLSPPLTSRAEVHLWLGQEQVRTTCSYQLLLPGATFEHGYLVYMSSSAKF